MTVMLPLHVFNMGDGDEGIKPFYIPAIFACVFTFFFTPRQGTLFKWLVSFFILSMSSSFISYFNGSLLEWIKLFVVIYCCFGLAFVDIDKILKLLSGFVPITLLVLIYSAFAFPQYRFQGFYNDPNYLCTTLLAFLFVSTLIFIKTKSRIIKIVQIVNIVIIYVLLLLTVSRTGFFCGIVFLFLIAILNIRRVSIKHTIYVTIICSLFYGYSADLINDTLSNLYERSFGEKSNIESGRETRSLYSFQNINFILDNPQYIPLGLGTGGVKPSGANQIPGLLKYRKGDGQDHNSWTSCFSEHGIFAFFCYFMIYVTIFLSIWRRKKSPIKYVAISAMFSIVIFSFSVYENTFLPYWWLIFFLKNSSIYQD